MSDYCPAVGKLPQAPPARYHFGPTRLPVRCGRQSQSRKWKLIGITRSEMIGWVCSRTLLEHGTPRRAHYSRPAKLSRGAKYTQSLAEFAAGAWPQGWAFWFRFSSFSRLCCPLQRPPEAPEGLGATGWLAPRLAIAPPPCVTLSAVIAVQPSPAHLRSIRQSRSNLP